MHYEGAAQAGHFFGGLAHAGLWKTETVIALAAGEEMHSVIRAAILGKYANVLVTDQKTTEYLLEN